MKKKYVKPEFYIEDFTMCQQIASGCTKTDGAQQYGGKCEFIVSAGDYDDEETSYFTSTIQSCTPINNIDCQDGPNTYGGYFYS